MGLVVPADLDRRTKLSWQRHGLRLSGLPDATQAEYDCRKLGLVTRIKSQQSCGGCYVFAGVGGVESANILAGIGTADTTDYSEQSVLDCGRVGGCGGGWPETVLEFARSSGIANTSDYPYVGHVEWGCRRVPHPNTIDDYGYVSDQAHVPPVQAIKNALVEHGSLPCAVAADAAFEAYRGGIFRGYASAINHAVQLVAWVTDPSIPEGGYWVVKNQWGEEWGEAGYARMAYGANSIGFGCMWARKNRVGPPVPPAPTPDAKPDPVGPTTLTGTFVGVFTPATPVGELAMPSCDCPDEVAAPTPHPWHHHDGPWGPFLLPPNPLCPAYPYYVPCPVPVVPVKGTKVKAPGGILSGGVIDTIVERLVDALIAKLTG
jgi:KDEL-tailed cysteine endopeptidase